jgi:hypothetical protein
MPENDGKPHVFGKTHASVLLYACSHESRGTKWMRMIGWPGGLYSRMAYGRRLVMYLKQ